jgi:hypothetical protein
MTNAMMQRAKTMTLPVRRAAWLATIAAGCALAAACGRGNGGAKQRVPAATEAAQYPEPRYPSYLKPVSSIEEVLPHVRPLVRNKTGFQGAGLGIAKAGDTVTFVTGPDADEMIVGAVKRAMEERDVKVNVVPEYEMVGVSKQDALEYRKIRRSYTAEQGYMEAATWVESNFPNPEAVKTWLKGRRPDLYDKLFPKNRELSPQLREVQQKLLLPNLGKGIQAYLTKHPEVRGIFWGKGGGTFLRRNLHPMEDKFLGLFLVDNRWDVMSALGTYPGDVWQLAEDQLMEPLVHVDKLTAKDPEGTDAWADINEEQAMHWARGVYQRGHLYMFPNQATGRFGYSVVDYPAFQKEWLPREPLAIIHGQIAGTTNHTGFFPRWEVHFNDNGYISEVKGGGLVGDALREFMQLPNINDLVYPFHNENHKGYWYLYEIAFGTHPKAFRNPQGLDDGTVIPERLRAGVIHWGLGITLHHDPGVQAQSQKLLDFTAKYNMPRDHGFHTHTYFTTYKVHLRNADRWVTLLDKGRMTSLDNAEVRALASRYGNPDQILAEDWRPEIPGINAPGNYMTDYAPDPWKTVKMVIDKVLAGTYEHFYPKTAAAPGNTGGH